MGELDDGPHAAEPAELSIAFSAEELAALTALLGLPPVPGAAASAMSPETLAAARRSLRARGVLAGLDGAAGPDHGAASTDAVATAVADLLLIVTAPRAAVEIAVSTLRAGAGPDGSEGASTATRRYAVTAPAGIDQADEDGVFRFTPFAAVDVLVRLAGVTGLIGYPTQPDGRLPAEGLTVPEDMLRIAAGEPDPGRAAATLVAAGLTTAEAGRVAEVIHDRERIVSVRVRRPTGPGRVEGMDACWAATTQGLIDWPAGTRARTTDPWYRPDQPVTIRPLDIRAVLGDLATSLTGDTADDTKASARPTAAATTGSAADPVDGP